MSCFVMFSLYYERARRFRTSSCNSGSGWDFAPSLKISFDVTKLVAAGVEYYADLGQVGHFGNASEQQHQLFPTLDLNFSPDWEVNFGVGFGLTPRTDDLVVKLILGRRF